MNTTFDPVSAPGQDAFLGGLDLTQPQIADFQATASQSLMHELRQPLGVIESIAYFVQITADDEQLCGHMQRIQAMLFEANRILERHSAPASAVETAAC